MDNIRWYGRPIEELSREELIQVVSELVADQKAILETRARDNRTLGELHHMAVMSRLRS